MHPCWAEDIKNIKIFWIVVYCISLRDLWKYAKNYLLVPCSSTGSTRTTNIFSVTPRMSKFIIKVHHAAKQYLGLIYLALSFSYNIQGRLGEALRKE